MNKQVDWKNLALGVAGWLAIVAMGWTVIWVGDSPFPAERGFFLLLTFIGASVMCCLLIDTHGGIYK